MAMGCHGHFRQFWCCFCGLWWSRWWCFSWATRHLALEWVSYLSSGLQESLEQKTAGKCQKTSFQNMFFHENSFPEISSEYIRVLRSLKKGASAEASLHLQWFFRLEDMRRIYGGYMLDILSISIIHVRITHALPIPIRVFSFSSFETNGTVPFSVPLSNSATFGKGDAAGEHSDHQDH